MVPAMKHDGYPGAYAAAVTACSATIGLVIPPSIPMVVFGLFTGADIAHLFLAGILPGLLMGVFLLVASYWLAVQRGYPAFPWRGWKVLAGALAGASAALLLPVIVVAGLVLGLATTAEIGAVAAVYAALVSLVLYRDLTLPGLWRATVAAAADSARILIIIAVSGGFVWILSSLGVAREIAALISAAGLEGAALLLLVAVILLLLGMLLEPITLLIVVVPLLAPAVIAGGVDLVQFGVVAVLAASIGLVTPPVGILLYITAAQAGAGATAVIRESLPFLLALLLLLGLIAVVPALTLWLPGRI